MINNKQNNIITIDMMVYLDNKEYESACLKLHNFK